MANVLEMVTDLVGYLVQSNLFAWWFPYILAMFVVALIFVLIRSLVRY